MEPNSNRGRSKSGRIDAGVQLDFIRPGKPVENAFIESINGRLRDECLNVHRFTSMAEAQDIIEAWRLDYNQRRPHSSLGHLTPNEFVGQRQTEQTAEEVLCSREELSQNEAKSEVTKDNADARRGLSMPSMT